MTMECSGQNKMYYVIDWGVKVDGCIDGNDGRGNENIFNLLENYKVDRVFQFKAGISNFEAGNLSNFNPIDSIF